LQAPATSGFVMLSAFVSGSTTVTTNECAAGTKLVGGGFRLEPQGLPPTAYIQDEVANVFVTRSAPVGGAWEVEAIAFGPLNYDVEVEAFAVCLQYSAGVETQVLTSDVSVAADAGLDRVESSTEECTSLGSDWATLGGGYTITETGGPISEPVNVEASVFGVQFPLAPLGSSTSGWSVRAAETSGTSQPWTLRSHALCGRALSGPALSTSPQSFPVTIMGSGLGYSQGLCATRPVLGAGFVMWDVTGQGETAPAGAKAVQLVPTADAVNGGWLGAYGIPATSPLGGMEADTAALCLVVPQPPTTTTASTSTTTTSTTTTSTTTASSFLPVTIRPTPAAFSLSR
jgi:hypothetical protein